MYNTSQLSCSVSACNVGVTYHREYFGQGQEHLNRTDGKVVEDERGKQSLDVSRQAAEESGDMTMSQRVSASDTADASSNVGLQTRPVGGNEICIEQTGTSKTDRTTAAAESDDSLQSGTVKKVAGVEVLDFISSSLCTEFTDASNKLADDGSKGGSEASDNDNNEFVCGDLQRNNAAELPELGSQEKVGFEADAITATDRWPTAMERKVRRLQTEVQQLLFDDSRSSRKRELRTSGRVLGGVRRNTQRSPLQRLRTIVSSRLSYSSQHPNKLNSRVSGNRT